MHDTVLLSAESCFGKFEHYISIMPQEDLILLPLPNLCVGTNSHQCWHTVKSTYCYFLLQCIYLLLLVPTAIIDCNIYIHKVLTFYIWENQRLVFSKPRHSSGVLFPAVAWFWHQASPCIIYDEQVALEKIFLRAVVWGGGFKPNQNTYSCCTGSARPSAPNVFKFSNHRGKSPR